MGDFREFATRWIQETLPSNFRGGVLFVDTPDPDHPRAGRISRRDLRDIFDEHLELWESILQNLHDGSTTIEQAADLVRERGAEHHIRICPTEEQLISALDRIFSTTRINSWNNGGRNAWDDKGYFVNVFWRE